MGTGGVAAPACGGGEGMGDIHQDPPSGVPKHITIWLKPLLWAWLMGRPASDPALGPMAGWLWAGCCAKQTLTLSPVFSPIPRAPLKVSPCSLASLASPRSLLSLHSPSSPPSLVNQASNPAARCLRSPRRRRGPRREQSSLASHLYLQAGHLSLMPRFRGRRWKQARPPIPPLCLSP